MLASFVTLCTLTPHRDGMMGWWDVRVCVCVCAWSEDLLPQLERLLPMSRVTRRNVSTKQGVKGVTHSHSHTLIYYGTIRIDACLLLTICVHIFI